MAASLLGLSVARGVEASPGRSRFYYWVLLARCPMTGSRHLGQDHWPATRTSGAWCWQCGHVIVSALVYLLSSGVLAVVWVAEGFEVGHVVREAAVLYGLAVVYVGGYLFAAWPFAEWGVEEFASTE